MGPLSTALPQHSHSFSQQVAEENQAEEEIAHNNMEPSDTKIQLSTPSINVNVDCSGPSTQIYNESDDDDVVAYVRSANNRELQEVSFLIRAAHY